MLGASALADKVRAQVCSDLAGWLEKDAEATDAVKRYGIMGAVDALRRWWFGSMHSDALQRLLEPHLHTETSEKERRSLILLREWFALHQEAQWHLDAEARKEGDPWRSEVHQKAHRAALTKRDELFDSVNEHVRAT